MFSISAKLEANLDPNDLLAAYGLEKGMNRARTAGASASRTAHEIGRVQRFIDQKVIDGCQPYVPASPDRTLEFSAQVSTDIGSGMVVCPKGLASRRNTPYAHYQYMGIVYGPNIPILDPETGVLMGYFSPPGRPKHPTGEALTYDTSQNPMAGPYWFERAYEETVHWTVSRIPWGKADQLRQWLDEARRVMIQG